VRCRGFRDERGSCYGFHVELVLSVRQCAPGKTGRTKTRGSKNPRLGAVFPGEEPAGDNCWLFALRERDLVHPSDQSGATLSRAIPTMAMSGRTESHALPRICLRNVDGFDSAAEQALGPTRRRDHLADQSRGFAAAHLSPSSACWMRVRRAVAACCGSTDPPRHRRRLRRRRACSPPAGPTESRRTPG